MNLKNRILIAVLLVLSLGVKAQDNIKSLTLEKAIQLSKSNNYEVLQALKRIEQSKKRVWETKALGLPQVDGSFNYLNNIKQQVSLVPAEFFGGMPGEFSEVVFGTKQSLNVSIGVNQLLFDGSYLVGLKSIKVFEKITEQAAEKTKHEIVSLVVEAYANAVLIRERINLVESNLEVVNKNLYEIKEIYKEGLTELQNVEQLELSQLKLENELKAVKRQEDLTENVLKFLIGIDLKNSVKLSDTIEKLILYSEKTKNIDFKVEKHIDYQIAENSLTAKELEYDLSRAKALPSLSTGFKYNLNAFGGSFPMNEKWFNSAVWNVSLNAPIFSSLKRTAKSQRMKLAIEEEEINQKQLKEKLVLEYEQKLVAYETALDQYKITIKSKKISKNIYEKENIKFLEGLTTSINLSITEKQFYDTQGEYLKAVKNLIQTKSQLNKSLGIN